MGYLSIIISIIKPCPLPPSDSSGRPYRTPYLGRTNRWTKKQILAISVSLFTVTALLVLNQGLLFVAPIPSNSSIKYNIDAYIIRTDEQGDADWSFNYRIANNTSQPEMHSGFTRIIECSDGGFVFVSPILNRDNSITYWGLSLVRIDEDGNPLWQQSFNEYNLEMGFSLVEVDQKGYAIAGTTRHYDGERNQWDRDVFVIQTDFNGNLIWAETYNGFNSDWACSVITCKSGGFAIVGKTEYYCETCSDVLLLRTDSEGQAQ